MHDKDGDSDNTYPLVRLEPDVVASQGGQEEEVKHRHLAPEVAHGVNSDLRTMLQNFLQI